MKQVEIAANLGISPTRVSRYLGRRMSRIEVNAPQAPEELALMRCILNERLEAIYTETFQEPICQRSLSVRLKCLDSLAKLHGLNLERPKRTGTMPRQPYATPAEIEAAVRAREQSADSTAALGRVELIR